MIKKIITIALLTILLITNGFAENNHDATLQLIDLLNNIQIINANFTQTVINKSGAVLQEQAGIIQLKKPNSLNWQVLNPDHISIVTDGKKIWHYDQDLEQVTIKNFASEINNTKFASLFFGDIEKTLNNFDISELENNCDVQICFELNSKKNNDDAFIKAQLGFNKSNQLVILRLYDQLDQETIFNFSKFKKTINPNIFKFQLPEGVDVIEE